MAGVLEKALSTVFLLILLENRKVIWLLVAIAVALLLGVLLDTVGGAVRLENCSVAGVMAVPATSCPTIFRL